MNDFDGESSQGAWILRVSDNVGGPVKPGTLNGWSLELTATEPFRCNPLSCGDPVPGAMGESLRVDPSGAEDLSFTWQSEPGATEYRIWRSTDPTLQGAVMVGQTAGTSLVESGGRTSASTLVFYQVRAVNSCNWEGP
jgi:subtilisin-like proprotein convertase family protein